MGPLYFVTSNEGKIKEAEVILDIPIHSVKVHIEEVQSLDLEKIAREKAKVAFELIHSPVIVDDAGLFIEAWNGFPGPFIKYLFDSVGNEGLLKMMKDETNRNVTAKAVIGFHNGKEVFTFTGEVRGTLAKAPRGRGGWSWDPVFIPAFTDKTYAELTVTEKNAISHRRLALDNFKKYLQQQ